MATPQAALELVQYLHLKLAALGQSSGKGLADAPFLQIASPLLRSHYQKERLLGKYLCPADTRVQSFLDETLRDCCPEGAPRLPASTFVLDRPGLARTLSLPLDAHSFSSPYLRSYRVPQGVLHNPANDRRTTRGVFHIAEGGFPIPADKQAVPKRTFAALLAAALRPPSDVLTLPFTASARTSRRACSSPCCCVLWSVRPPVPTRPRRWKLDFSCPAAWSATWISSKRSSAMAATRIFPKMMPRSTWRIGRATPAA